MKKQDFNKININFIGIGWKTKIMQKRATFSISINKLVAEGNCLEKGEELYSYLAEDESGRKIIITYLDKKKFRDVYVGAKKRALDI